VFVDCENKDVTLLTRLMPAGPVVGAFYLLGNLYAISFGILVHPLHSPYDWLHTIDVDETIGVDVAISYVDECAQDLDNGNGQVSWIDGQHGVDTFVDGFEDQNLLRMPVANGGQLMVDEQYSWILTDDKVASTLGDGPVTVVDVLQAVFFGEETLVVCDATRTVKITSDENEVWLQDEIVCRMLVVGASFMKFQLMKKRVVYVMSTSRLQATGKKHTAKMMSVESLLRISVTSDGQLTIDEQHSMILTYDQGGSALGGRSVPVVDIIQEVSFHEEAFAVCDARKTVKITSEGEEVCRQVEILRQLLMLGASFMEFQRRKKHVMFVMPTSRLQATRKKYSAKMISNKILLSISVTSDGHLTTDEQNSLIFTYDQGGSAPGCRSFPAVDILQAVPFHEETFVALDVTRTVEITSDGKEVCLQWEIVCRMVVVGASFMKFQLMKKRVTYVRPRSGLQATGKNYTVKMISVESLLRISVTSDGQLTIDEQHSRIMTYDQGGSALGSRSIPVGDILQEVSYDEAALVVCDAGGTAKIANDGEEVCTQDKILRQLLMPWASYMELQRRKKHAMYMTPKTRLQATGKKHAAKMISVENILSMSVTSDGQFTIIQKKSMTWTYDERGSALGDRSAVAVDIVQAVSFDEGAFVACDAMRTFKITSDGKEVCLQGEIACRMLVVGPSFMKFQLMKKRVMYVRPMSRLQATGKKYRAKMISVESLICMSVTSGRQRTIVQKNSWIVTYYDQGGCALRDPTTPVGDILHAMLFYEETHVVCDATRTVKITSDGKEVCRQDEVSSRYVDVNRDGDLVSCDKSRHQIVNLNRETLQVIATLLALGRDGIKGPRHVRYALENGLMSVSWLPERGIQNQLIREGSELQNEIIQSSTFPQLSITAGELDIIFRELPSYPQQCEMAVKSRVGKDITCTFLHYYYVVCSIVHCSKVVFSCFT